MNTNCIFCRIASHEIPADIVYEDDILIAFLDINPVTKGHTLIIPKSHHPWMQDAPHEIVQQVFTTAQRLMRSMQQSIDADYVQLSVVGTEVPHFHVHVIPQQKNDELPPVFRKHTAYQDNAEKESIIECIKKTLT